MSVHSPEHIKITMDGFARDCVCGWQGVLWSNRIGADREYVAHVALDAAKAVARRLVDLPVIE